MHAAWLSFSRAFSATLWRAAAEWVCVSVLTSLLNHFCFTLRLVWGSVCHLSITRPTFQNFHYSTPRFLRKPVAIILLPPLSTTKTKHGSNNTQHIPPLPSELIPIIYLCLSLFLHSSSLLPQSIQCRAGSTAWRDCSAPNAKLH